MFWGKKSEKQEATKENVEKLLKPKSVTGLVSDHLIVQYKLEPDLIKNLKFVVRKSPNSEKAFDCRIFDPLDAESRNVEVKGYTSLDEQADLILYEGWFDEQSKRVELAEKKKWIYDGPFFTQEEIQQKIEKLSEPGSTVFFYQARGPAIGGPLGRGAAIAELNPNYPGKKEKKYILYTANVIGMEPVAEKNKLFDSDKPKDLAKWIKEAHTKRLY